MQFARFVGTFGLVLGLAGLAIGCGSQQGSKTVLNEEGKTFKEQLKQEHLDLQAERKGAAAAKAKRVKNR